MLKSNKGLQAKLFSSFLFVGLIVVIVALIGWNFTSALGNNIRMLSENAFPSTISLWKANEAQSRILAAERSLLITTANFSQRQQVLTEVQKGLEDLNKALTEYNKGGRDQQEDQIYKKLTAEFEKWKQTNQDFLDLNNEFQKYGVANPRQLQLNLLIQGKANAPEFAAAKVAADALGKMNDFAFTTLNSAFSSLTNALQELAAYNQKFGDTVTNKAKQDVSQSATWMVLSLVIGPLTAILLGLYFSTTIVKSLGEQISGVVGVAEQISVGDLTAKVLVSDRQDEVSKLQLAIRNMSDRLNSLIRQVQQSGIQITTSATQIAASGKQLEATMTEQVASTNEVAVTAKRIAATSRQLVKTMDEVEGTSQATTQAAGSSQKELIQMESSMRKLADATGTISTKLAVINEKANNINSIVTTITKVADQTNLLSLNAAIEAEKAGEYGTGFAVVAREIRRLADQTAVATLDIENMVKEMQGAVSTGVMEMDKFTKDVEKGVQDVHNIGNKLESIIDKVQSITPRFREVNNSMENQSEGAEQISEAMVQLSESSAQTAQSLREINGAISQLTEAAQGLRLEVSRFKLSSER